MAKVKRKPPTKYQKALGNLIAKMIKAGHTNKEIAEECGISTRTLYTWRNTQPDISQAIRNAPDIPNRLVEAALFSLCVGYTVESEEVDNDGNTHKKIHSHVKPDLGAIRHWQRNKDPENWKEEERIEVELERPIRLSELENATADELMAAIKKEINISKGKKNA